MRQCRLFISGSSHQAAALKDTRDGQCLAPDKNMQSPESLANKIRIAPSATAVVALVGRANVGKSTLFNYLSKNHLSKNHPSLVLDYEGVTRDRIYASVDYPLTSPQGTVQPVQFILIDTPGLCTDTTLADLAQQQTQQAMAEADLLLVVLDLRAGLLTTDLQCIATIRQRCLL